MESFQKHPDFAVVLEVYHTLAQAGYQVLMAGGCVRDGLIGKVPRDFDLATNAKPEEVQKLFQKTIDIGKDFGVIIVVQGASQIEVTTFRSDLAYVDGRRPQGVHFSTPEIDATRRDFTVNALFYDWQSKKVLDFVGGVDDLNGKTLRAVGDATQRFAEDHLRILRAIRFVGQLGFLLESSTWKAVQAGVKLVATVSAERRREELEKLLTSGYRKLALELYCQAGFSEVFFEGQSVSCEASKFISGAQDFSDNPAEQAWIEYWFWLFKSGLSLDQKSFRKTMQAWRFSKAEIEEFERAVYWHWESDLSKVRLGLLAERLFHKSSQLGLELSGMRQSEIAKQALAVVHKNSDEKPLPVLQAADLTGLAQGARLGELLREAYLLQLEGVVISKTMALEWVRKQL